MNKACLEQYKLLEKEIDRIKKRINYYLNKEVQSEHGVVKGSMTMHPYKECHIVLSAPNIKSEEKRNATIRQLVIELNENKRKYEDMKLEIELFFEKIPDIEMKSIMIMRYVEGMELKEIAFDRGYDLTTISKKISDYVNKL